MPKTVTLSEVSEGLDTLGAGGLLRQLHIVALDYAAQAETRAKTRASTILKPRSGRLRASIAGRVVKRKRYIAVKLSAGGGGKDVKYAAAHEYGATIRPVRAKMLAIPVHKSLQTQAKVGRVPGPRDVTGLTFAISAKGQRMLIHETTKEVWYILRQRVVIPKRPYLAPSIKDIEAKMMPEVRKLLRGELT